MTQPRSEMIPPSKVYVVDRAASATEALRRFSRTSGIDVMFFRASTDFVREYSANAPGCLVLGIEPPGDAEIALVQTIRSRRDPLEIVALGAKGAVGIAVRSLKAGVFHLIEKPGSDFELIANVASALDKARRNFATFRQWTDFERRLAELTDRQREILHHIVLGKANKVIAMDLGISERTVEVHRHRLLRRMCVGSAVELARLAGEFQAVQIGTQCACAAHAEHNGYVRGVALETLVAVAVN